MKIRYSFLVIGVMLFAGSLLAENAVLQPIAGTWHCSGTAFASPMGPEHPTEGIVHADWVLGGNWLRADYQETKTAKNPNPIMVQMFMSVTPDKKVVSSCFDSMGGYCTQEGTGWQGDKLMISGTGHAGPDTMKVRDTFTKGKGTIKHLGEMQDSKGAWMKLDEETCKK